MGKIRIEKPSRIKSQIELLEPFGKQRPSRIKEKSFITKR